MINFVETEEKKSENVIEVKPVDLTGTIDRVGINELHMGITKCEIKTPAEYEIADALLKKVNSTIKVTEESLDDHTKDLKAKLDLIRSHYKKPLEILTTLKKTCKEKMLSFQLLLERERVKQQEALRLKAQQEAKKLEERAAKAVASGKAEKAQALQEQAAMVANNVPVVDNSVKTEGTHFTTTYKYEVENESLIPDVYWQLNEVMIGKQVRGSEGKQIIPGIKIIAVKTLVSQ